MVRPWKRTSMPRRVSPLVFLDIDGVLAPFDSDRPIEQQQMAVLNRVLIRTGADVVVTSSWRERYAADELQQLLSQEGLGGIVIGCTPVIFGATRGDEIRSYLSGRSNNAAFVILDDVPDMDYELRRRLVLVDSDVGLQQLDGDRAVALLEKAANDSGKHRE